MKALKHLLFLALVTIISTSCATVFFSTDAYTLANNHKLIAIVPPTVSIAAKRKVNPEALIEQQKTESVNFQKEMHAWMLKRKMQGKINVEILDIETTNAKLKKAGFPETPLTPTEICEVLGVDAILGSNYAMTKPMSEGAAVVVGLLVGVWGPTNEVHVTMNIQDYANKKLIWNYDHKYSGGVGSSPARLVDGLMKNASKKMPYIKKN